MQIPEVPRAPGVFVIYHQPTGQAYVSETRDLKQRAMLWDARLLQYENGGMAPAKDFPRHPSAEWAFVVSGEPLEVTRQTWVAKGWRLLNEFKPRKVYTVQYLGEPVATVGSLAVHCKKRDIKLHTAYKRLARGMTIEQALDLSDVPLLDKRDLAISQMRVQIESASGGLLTYDEAIMMRPEIGDVREKLRRLRKKDPSVTRVKLSEI